MWHRQHLLKPRYRYQNDPTCAAGGERNGKVLIFSGLPTGIKLTIDPNYLHYNELTLYGSIDSTIDDYKRTALMAPYLGLERFATHLLPFEKIKEAFEATKEKDRLRVNLQIMK